MPPHELPNLQKYSHLILIVTFQIVLARFLTDGVHNAHWSLHQYQNLQSCFRCFGTALPKICISKVHGIQFKQQNNTLRPLIIPNTIAMEKLQEIPMKVRRCRKLSQNKTIPFHAVNTHEKLFNAAAFFKNFVSFFESYDEQQQQQKHSTQSEANIPWTLYWCIVSRKMTAHLSRKDLWGLSMTNDHMPR